MSSQVLFAFGKNSEALFFSIPQRQNHDEILSSGAANFVAKTPSVAYYEEFSNINGLVFIRKMFISDDATAVICNPSTSQSFSIPHSSFFGYDPIEKQFKLLSVFMPNCKVLTLGSGNLLWRDVLCSAYHSPLRKGICIDGVLYYVARVKNAVDEWSVMIVSFDIKSEKFTFMKPMENYIVERRIATLINYDGKLASVKMDDTNFVNRRSEILKIWVLEDHKKQEWSQRIHLLPPLWKDVVGNDDLLIVGAIGTDEIVLSSIYCNSSFYLIYYNTKKKNVVKVEIQGMEMSKGVRVHTYLNHVENLKLLS